MECPENNFVPSSEGMLYLAELKRKGESVCSSKVLEAKRPKAVDSVQIVNSAGKYGLQTFQSCLPTMASLMSIPESSDCLNQQSEVCPIAATSLSSTQNMSYSDLRDEPSPLGLSLRKSQSLIDLIQQGLEQSDKSLPSVSEQAVEENERAKGMVPVEIQQDKLKASNFPGCYIKIGKWECSSRYAGDLVAKFYYAKRKLVWEVLENGLKSKIEIQWSDITGIKAGIPDKGPSSLHIEVSRPPLFFKETNPQPRKHTLWQSTTDFTGGNASFCCRHFLLFPEGVLNRHFDKLIQCDPCLKTLSERNMPFAGSPFFEGEVTMVDTYSFPQSPPSGHVSSVMAFQSFRSEALRPFNYVPVPIMKRVEAPRFRSSGLKIALTEAQPHSPSSVMDARANEESSSSSDTEDLNVKEKLANYDCHKQSGPAPLIDHDILHGASLVASATDHSNLYPVSMVSHTTLRDFKLFSDAIVLAQKDASSSEKQCLERSSLNLIHDKLYENIQANGQDFSAEPFLKRGETVCERNLSNAVSEIHMMVPTLAHITSNNPSNTCLVESWGLPPALKERDDHTHLLPELAKKESYKMLQLDETVSSLQKYMSCSKWSR